MTPIRVGMIGLGSFSRIALLPVLVTLEDVEMTACMSRTQVTVDQVARQYGFAKKYTSVDHLIQDGGITAAFVATPKQTHSEIVLPLLQNGIDVFCEKPIAMSLADGERLVRCSEENKRIFMIGFNRRYAPVYEKAKEALGASPPEVCVAIKNRPGTEFRATMENTIHMVDLMRWFCGECYDVQAHSRFVDPNYETTTAALLRFDSGTIGLLLGNRSCGQWTERMEFHGGNRSIMVDSPDSLTIIDSKQEHTMRMTPLRMGWATVQEKMGFEQEIIHFLRCVETREEPRTSARDALKTHQLLDRILRQAGLPTENGS